jgi:hypothetical protein
VQWKREQQNSEYDKVFTQLLCEGLTILDLDTIARAVICVGIKYTMHIKLKDYTKSKPPEKILGQK